jgi:hypothetical protein
VTKELPLYISHKKVRALEIRSTGGLSFDASGRPMRELIFADPGFLPIWVSGDLFVRYTPVPGDYYVLYEDGYNSISPRKAFLEGYSPANDGNVLMERLSDLADTSKTLPPEAVPEWAKGHDFWVQVARVAREAYVTINSLKSQLENLNREKADPDQS